MRIEQLHYLIAVSQHKSMTAAAKEIHVSQQNLSVALRNLENEFGVQLLVRSPQGIALTPEGEMFVHKAQEIVAKIDELYDLFSKEKPVKKVLKGRLQIEVVPFMTLPDVLVSFQKLHPQVTLTLRENSPPRIVKNVAQGMSDIGIIIRTVDEPGLVRFIHDLGLHYDTIIEDRVFVCAGKKSPLRHRHVISLPELLKQKLIVWGVLYDWLLEILMGHQDPAKLQIQKSDNVQIYKKVIEEGLAVGFVTGIGLEKELIFKKGEIKAISIEQHNRISIALVYPPENALSETAKEFIAHLKSATQDYRG
ncbi:MAG TPA: LysR family transcriptional regulator [Clostridia bacterium]|nr:LysR family transcriptional regulator [Clostridia bacterium]